MTNIVVNSYFARREKKFTPGRRAVRDPRNNHSIFPFDALSGRQQHQRQRPDQTSWRDAYTSLPQNGASTPPPKIHLYCCDTRHPFVNLLTLNVSFSCTEILKHFTTLWKTFSHGVSRVTSNVTRVTSDVTGVTSDVTRVTSDVTRVTSDVTHVTSDVTHVTSDVTRVTRRPTRVTRRPTRVTRRPTRVTWAVTRPSGTMAKGPAALPSRARAAGRSVGGTRGGGAGIRGMPCHALAPGGSPENLDRFYKVRVWWVQFFFPILSL